MFSTPTSRQPSAASALRSLHSQISSTVIDYSPWMRQKRREQKADDHHSQTRTVVVGLPPLREERKCSARCQHMRKEATPDLIAPENPAKIQWLTLQLNMYRTRIQDFHQLEHDLIENNTQLRENVSSTERECHDTVAKNIRRFDQYKKTISLVEVKQIEEKQSLLESLDQERQTLANEVEMYENQVVTLENQLSDCQQLLKQLKTYKDSEYPEKEQLLQKLLQDIEETKLFSSEEIDELHRILQKQREQHHEQFRQTVIQLQDEQATTAFSDMHVSYMLVAMDNNRMKQEIAIQEGRLHLMEVEYEHLKKLNQQLRVEQSEAFDSRRLFPHVFRKDTIPICTPDMDVVLNLPKRPTPLPV